MMGRFGLVSLGHGGFMGVGAYVTALLWNHLGAVAVDRHSRRACSAAAVLALIVAYPCFRFRITGHYFALVTLALSGIVLQVITATRDYTGGSLGYTPDRTKGSHSVALQFDDKVDLVPDRARRLGGGAADLVLGRPQHGPLRAGGDLRGRGRRGRGRRQRDLRRSSRSP